LSLVIITGGLFARPPSPPSLWHINLTKPDTSRWGQFQKRNGNASLLIGECNQKYIGEQEGSPKQPLSHSFFQVLCMVACALRFRKLSSIVKGLGSKIWPHKVSFQLTKDLREYYRKDKLILNRKMGRCSLDCNCEIIKQWS
jgi:hypothetical protein